MTLASQLLKPKVLILCLSFAAFAVRVYNLSYESFNMDEADGVYLASVPISQLLGSITRVGESGQLYLLLLKGWMAVAGSSEFAVRFLALMPGVLVVPMMYRLGRALLGSSGAALVAALLVSFSTYLLYFSQMNRMYSLMLLLSIVASYLVLKAAAKNSWRLWVAYGVSIVGAIYLQVFAVLLIPWHFGFLFIRFREYGASVLKGVAVLAIIGTPHLTVGLWLLRALDNPDQVLSRQFTGPRSLPGMLATLAREYGTLYDLLPLVPVSMFFVALGGFGLAALARGQSRGSASLFLGLAVAVPLVLVYLLTLAGIPAFSSRYLIITLPSFFLLWGWAIATLHGRSRSLALAVVAAMLALNYARWAETNVYGDQFREDWRSAVAYLSTRYQPGDLVLLARSNVAYAYGYYSEQPAAILGTDQMEGGDVGNIASEELARATEGYQALWLLYANFQESNMTPLTPWLEDNSYKLSEVYFPGIKVAKHLLRSPMVDVGESSGLAGERVNFGNKLELLGYKPSSPPDKPAAPWQLLLHWRALQPIEAEYSASVRMVDAQGNMWGRSEGPIGGGVNPTDWWEPGQVFLDQRELALVPGAPPGEYELVVLVYRRKDLENLWPVPPSAGLIPQGELGQIRLDAPASATGAGPLPVTLRNGN